MLWPKDDILPIVDLKNDIAIPRQAQQVQAVPDGNITYLVIQCDEGYVCASAQDRPFALKIFDLKLQNVKQMFGYALREPTGEMFPSGFSEQLQI